MSYSATPPAQTTRSTRRRGGDDGWSGTPAAATANLANAPRQGEIVACLAAMIKYGQQVTEKSKEWAPLKAELERNEKVEQEGKEEIKELARKRTEIERQMAEKERDVETAASRSAISRKKMGELEKIWGEEPIEQIHEQYLKIKANAEQVRNMM